MTLETLIEELQKLSIVWKERDMREDSDYWEGRDDGCELAAKQLDHLILRAQGNLESEP